MNTRSPPTLNRKSNQHINHIHISYLMTHKPFEWNTEWHICTHPPLINILISYFHIIITLQVHVFFIIIFYIQITLPIPYDTCTDSPTKKYSTVDLLLLHNETTPQNRIQKIISDIIKSIYSTVQYSRTVVVFQITRLFHNYRMGSLVLPFIYSTFGKLVIFNFFQILFLFVAKLN